MRTFAEIIERLEDSRLSRGLTRTELGKRLGIRQNAMSNRARRHGMQVSTLLSWAEALGLEIVLVPASVAKEAEELNR